MIEVHSPFKKDVFQLETYAYKLPSELIAQEPLPERDTCRLFVLWKRTRVWEDTHFYRLMHYLRPGDLLILNVSRVIPVRIFTHKTGVKREIECLFIRKVRHHQWLALVRPGRRVHPGDELILDGKRMLKVLERREKGLRVIELPSDLSEEDFFQTYGHVPLPHYIRKGRDRPEDREWYQTIYAQIPGSVAAPTAGLHFTERLLSACKRKGVDFARIVLHVGPGTFRPIRTRNIRQHTLDPEYFEIPERVWEKIYRTRSRGGRCIAVGTTSVRAIEYSAQFEPPKLKGWTDLYITPGFTFKVVDGLITNFHLPKSSLLVLVSAFTNVETILTCYKKAIERKYRFYSYGDAMLILP